MHNTRRFTDKNEYGQTNGLSTLGESGVICEW